MDYSNIIQPNRLTNMQEMEVNVNGPDGANRLFMYSGMAEVELCGGLPHPRWSLEIVCFDIGRRQNSIFIGFRTIHIGCNNCKKKE